MNPKKGISESAFKSLEKFLKNILGALEFNKWKDGNIDKDWMVDFKSLSEGNDRVFHLGDQPFINDLKKEMGNEWPYLCGYIVDFFTGKLEKICLQNSAIVKYVRFKDIGKNFEGEKYKIEKQLREYDFQGADFNFEKNRKLYSLDQTEYEKSKALYVNEYFIKYYRNTGEIDHAADMEQSEAIGATGDNILVSARAGSGKTEIISAKVALLVEKYEIKPDEIMVLCFNNSAAKSMKKRIKKYIPTFENARTFHSWAMSILFNKENDIKDIDTDIPILVDETGMKSNYDLENYLEKIIEENSQELFQEIYEFQKEGSLEEENLIERNKKRYRNCQYVKLKESKKEERFYHAICGERVRSLGEKWIADFLVENGFIFLKGESKKEMDRKTNGSYFSYEKYFDGEGVFPSKEAWKPDFTIMQNGKKIVWEHWAIDAQKFIYEEQYEKDYESKRRKMGNCGYNFELDGDVKNKNRIFLETEAGDIPKFNNRKKDAKQSREEFELFLSKKLQKCGIVLPTKERKDEIKQKLIEEVWNRTKEKGLKNFTQFIGCVQKNGSPNWEREIENQIDSQSLRAQKFIRLATKITKLYFQKRDEACLYDFDKILLKTIPKIKENKQTQNLKWLLIDEFQDFSNLFQNLIDTVRETNPEVKLFCVGDPWQLINEYAGSRMELFDAFEKEANNKTIATCYRSWNSIVDLGNKFALNQGNVFEGEISKPTQSNKGRGFSSSEGSYRKYCSTFFDLRGDSEEGVRNSELYEIKKNNNFMLSEQIKQSCEIIKNNLYKSHLILSRDNDVHFIDKQDILRKIESALKEEIAELPHKIVENIKELNEVEKNNKFIAVSTMHSAKGLEADIVIILDVCDGTIPKFHPDNELFEVFGRTPDKILDEEKRLFYVALTRAKEKVFVLTEKGNESEFLTDLFQN